jgi:hypothetical protein
MAVGLGVPATLLACNSALGICMASCAVVTLWYP